MGDFYQLPPVVVEQDSRGIYAFQAILWAASIHLTFVLKEYLLSLLLIAIFVDFIQILNKLHVGQVTKKTEDIMKSLKHPLALPDQRIILSFFESI
ncbi:hypothetical protein BC938DRAFT_472004 [Jimgerdemannia flammicorona]|uniref:DNA helicase n=1 Tax=Jimgerdemannia flammicorona TaxID=994334 RepID=A0A433QZW6_9FUNG|nr:hypothetical protein BC938DRAFT_472004 [Jimgerdemannia flammicorona]